MERISNGNAKMIEVNQGDHSMSIGTILLIVLIIIRSLLWNRLLRGRRARTRGRYPLDLGLARQAVKGRPRLQLR
jgi:hypothetical protein